MAVFPFVIAAVITLPFDQWYARSISPHTGLLVDKFIVILAVSIGVPGLSALHSLSSTISSRSSPRTISTWSINLRHETPFFAYNTSSENALFPSYRISCAPGVTKPHGSYAADSRICHKY